MANDITTRLTVGEQLLRGPALRGRPLAVLAKTPSGKTMRTGEVLKNLPHLLASGIKIEVRTLAGNLLYPAALIGKTPKQIDGLAARIDKLLMGIDQLRKNKSAGGVAAPQESILAEMTMIDDNRLSFKVAKDIVPGSLTNGRNIAAAENKSGRKLRIPTEPELLQLNKLLGNQLEGTRYWIWTETEHKDYPGCFVLRRRLSDGRGYCRPDDGCINYAVRFVEDR